MRNRFKGLDLIDRVPDELWMEVLDIVQETGIKTIPMEKKCKKAKWLSGEALKIAVKGKEAKSKAEKARKKIKQRNQYWWVIKMKIKRVIKDLKLKKIFN